MIRIELFEELCLSLNLSVFKKINIHFYNLKFFKIFTHEQILARNFIMFVCVIICIHILSSVCITPHVQLCPVSSIFVCFMQSLITF